MLLNVEVGISLRSLCVALELAGLPAGLDLPDASSAPMLADLGLTPTTDWTLPMRLRLGAPASAATSWPPEPPPTDPIHAHVVAVNRELAPPQPSAPVSEAIPALAGTRLSWAQVLWERTSGSMPRGMYGANGRRRTVDGAALLESAAWLRILPPGALWREVAQNVAVSAVVQTVNGYAPGIYRVRDGVPVLHSANPQAAALLERHYRYSLATWRGCDIRHAAVLWFFSVRPRSLVRRFGPSAWNLAQNAVGWMLHGVCLASAAHGLYALPVGAFSEPEARPILGLDDNEMIIIAVVTGTPRHRGFRLDLRQ